MSDAGRAILITTETPFAAFDGMTRELAAGLERLGVPSDIIIIDDILADTEAFMARLRTWKTSKPRFVLGWNAKLHLTYGGKNAHDTLGVPLFAPLLDHPADHHEHLMQRPQHGVVSVCDRRHLLAFEDAPWPTGPTMFLPHGGPPANTSALPHGDRRIGAIFLGNVPKPPDLARILAEALPGACSHMPAAAAKLVYRAETEMTDTADLLAEIYNDVGLDRPVSGPEFATFCRLVTETNTAAVLARRIKVLNAPTKSPVHVIGNIDPESGVRTRENLRIYGSVKFSDLSKVLEESCVVLNVTPKFRDGGHERLFLALAERCALITDENQYLKETMGAESGIGYWPELGTSQDYATLIDSLASDPNQSEQLVERDMGIYVEQHTWTQRAKDILHTIDQL